MSIWTWCYEHDKLRNNKNTALLVHTFGASQVSKEGEFYGLKIVGNVLKWRKIWYSI